MFFILFGRYAADCLFPVEVLSSQLRGERSQRHTELTRIAMPGTVYGFREQIAGTLPAEALGVATVRNISSWCQ